MSRSFLMTGFMTYASIAGCSDDAATGDAGVVADAGSEDAASDAGADGGDPGSRHDALFVGNSYVFVNDVSGHYRAIAETLFDEVRVEVAATGGYRFADHLADARTDGTPLARFLRTGTAEETSFDAMILQEQSQLGGFPETNGARRASIEAASELAALASAHEVPVILYLTWGRERGDELNPDLFPTFEAMQDRLDANVLALARHLAARGSSVRVAPVGAGFAAVFDDVTAAGADPLAEGSDFDALYEPDGSHPSLRGSYLAACILAGAVTGADPALFPDEATLGSDVSRSLRDACARALADVRWRFAGARTTATTLGGTAAGARFGHSVALSDDGTRLVIGVPSDDAGTGTARILSRTSEGWVEEAILTPGDRDSLDNFGWSVALDGAGTRAIVGAYLADDHRGQARIFVRTGTSWTEEALLTDADPVRVEYFGESVALSDDGTRALVATPNDRTSPTGPGDGIARVFVRAGSAWSEEAVLEASDVTPGVPFGSVLAFSGDGARALVGGRAASTLPRVFVRSGSEWSEEAAIPVDSIDEAALDADGDVALVSTPSSRFVRAFRRSGSTWTEEAVVARGDPLGSSGNVSLALGADGSLALAGTPRTDAAGVPAAGLAQILDRSGSAWSTGEALLSSEPAELDDLGRSVALSADGRVAIVGAPGALGGRGAVHVFELR